MTAAFTLMLMMPSCCSYASIIRFDALLRHRAAIFAEMRYADAA